MSKLTMVDGLDSLPGIGGGAGAGWLKTKDETERVYGLHVVGDIVNELTVNADAMGSCYSGGFVHLDRASRMSNKTVLKNFWVYFGGGSGEHIECTPSETKLGQIRHPKPI